MVVTAEPEVVGVSDSEGWEVGGVSVSVSVCVPVFVGVGVLVSVPVCGGVCEPDGCAVSVGPPLSEGLPVGLVGRPEVLVGLPVGRVPLWDGRVPGEPLPSPSSPWESPSWEWPWPWSLPLCPSWPFPALFEDPWPLSGRPRSGSANANAPPTPAVIRPVSTRPVEAATRNRERTLSPPFRAPPNSFD
ncbi:hypothetical protein EJD98_15000 [Mycolicibacterium peregrinum]|uniref:Uncharacterized protein n=1 Tax=Mycolicibacterium peregrinum TaxID=43304 RepID=A0A4Z0HIR1_MYCPR|nr:hypothetical protein EJD94_22740 [Mycolicibacterium peregrinum]TGB42087.1 hypothetical protein EJD98_15000 [Mycolicibacterium peregrinum]